MYIYEVVGPSEYDQSTYFATYAEARKYRRIKYQGLALIWRLSLVNSTPKMLLLRVLNAEPYAWKFELRKGSSWIEIKHLLAQWEEWRGLE